MGLVAGLSGYKKTKVTSLPRPSIPLGGSCQETHLKQMGDVNIVQNCRVLPMERRGVVMRSR